MKTSLDHLPIINQKELQEIAEYVDLYANQIKMIILFGSYARGDWVVDNYQEENGSYTSYHSDYDLLLVVKNEAIAKNKTDDGKIDKRIRKNVNLKTPMNIIFHGIDYLNEQIEKQSYFFIDIYKEGIMLFDREEYKLSKPKIITKQTIYEDALKSFEKWFNNANTFLEGYNFYISKVNENKEFYCTAAFNLHQTTERLLKTTWLVFTAYKPKTHNLDELYFKVKKLDKRFKGVFPINTDEEERLFKVLKDAYIDSRYKIDYKISEKDLFYLEKRIVILKNLTEKICLEKIEQFKNEIE